MAVEIRKPKKGAGVPKETPARHNLAALQELLAQSFLLRSKNDLRAELEKRGFFAAGMLEQVRLMAQVAFELAARPAGDVALITALAKSPVEKIRALAAFVVPFIFPTALPQQLEWLRFTAALEGTWPREASATILHNLAIQHGVMKILPTVQEWIHDPNPAVRRVVTEGLRPRGVMLAHINELKEDPAPLKTILAPLLDDDSDYVQKSVANHLNDISKDHPEIILEWTREWNTPNATKQRHWILARALRTLIEEGHPAALRLLGYGTNANLQVTWQDNTPRRLKINQFLPCDLEIVNLAKTEASVVALLHLDEPGKGKTRRKSIYQIWKGKIKANEMKNINKKIHFVDKNSQPRLEGVYGVSLMLNGKKLEGREMSFKR